MQCSENSQNVIFLMGHRTLISVRKSEIKRVISPKTRLTFSIMLLGRVNTQRADTMVLCVPRKIDEIQTREVRNRELLGNFDRLGLVSRTADMPLVGLQGRNEVG